MALSVGDVWKWLKVNPAPAADTDDHAVMTRVLDAVVANAQHRCIVRRVETFYIGTEEYAPDGEESYAVDDWPADVVQAVTMAAARLYRRQSTPEGIASFPDLAVLSVRQYDPDIEALLAPHLTFGF